ncbi:unnamed protein product [Paramecium octaurelia]|uniref:Uncharacterized protein n=1 Tax=Paramecium octaurelia TaxID=43137 RepID=A0A8S1YKZ8_PAROT|nr:unnamed protein product [Paramecium octaurelia]
MIDQNIVLNSHDRDVFLTVFSKKINWIVLGVKIIKQQLDSKIDFQVHLIGKALKNQYRIKHSFYVCILIKTKMNQCLEVTQSQRQVESQLNKIEIYYFLQMLQDYAGQIKFKFQRNLKKVF